MRTPGILRRVVDQEVDGPLCRGHHVSGAPHSAAVSATSHRIVSEARANGAGQVGRQLVEPLGVPRQADHRRPGAGKITRQLGAQSRRGARDHRDPALVAPAEVGARAEAEKMPPSTPLTAPASGGSVSSPRSVPSRAAALASTS